MRPLRSRALPAALATLILSSLAVSSKPRDAREGTPRERVRSAAMKIYFHGISGHEARRAIGSEDWPELLTLLGDAEFPRRDNVVAFLMQLPDARAVDPLVALIEAPVGSPGTVPEDERALLLAPEALGRIAKEADRATLEQLLDATAPGLRTGRLARAIASGPHDEALRGDLVEATLWGLARSGRPEAREHLRWLADADAATTIHGVDVRAVARRAHRDFDLFSAGAVAVAPASPLTAGPKESAASSAGTSRASRGSFQAVVDPEVTSHGHGVTYANHVDLLSPMSNSRLDAILGSASLSAATSDFPDDVSCCVSFSRTGSLATFGVGGDGLDIVEDAAERDAVLGNPVARVKVVRTIRFCSGNSSPNANILGCASTPGDTMMLVRASSGIEPLLWWHEYGHNVGLDHVEDAANIMNGSVSASGNTGLELFQCDAFHNPSVFARAELTDAGVCHDDDVDLIASNVDNCPDDSNADQADAEADGAGDLCDNCPSSFNPSQADADNDGIGDACDCLSPGEDPDLDGICSAADNCPDDFNPAQADDDGDGIGDACDECTDVDGDGFGLNGGAGCAHPGPPDCNDSLASVYPGAFDNCDGLDNDCTGGVDSGTCDIYEFTGDGVYDGVELSWLGRSFGLCSATPATEWWFPVDYDQDGCVDGQDLAVMAAIWGCAGIDRICP